MNTTGLTLMAKKQAWRICSVCLNKFIARDEWEMDKVFNTHKVTTDQGQKCMGETQRLMTFKRNGNAWELK